MTAKEIKAIRDEATELLTELENSRLENAAWLVEKLRNKAFRAQFSSGELAGFAQLASDLMAQVAKWMRPDDRS
jgi:tRNA C32,U32 (ribose-2'-O)-methylase TrmJ